MSTGMKYFWFSVLTFMLFSVNTIQAENTEIDEIKKNLPNLLGQSNVGREFWFTIPPVYEDESGGAANFIKIFVTSSVKTLVTCEVPGTGFYSAKPSKPNDVICFDIEPEEGQPFLFSGRTDDPRPEEVFEGRGIHIYADDPLVVYVVARYRATSDGFLAIPVSGFGTEYISATYPDMVVMYSWAKSFPSMTGVVAAFDNTKVKFTTGGNEFTETAGGIKTGQSETFDMNKGDVIMFMSNGMEQDLTGSKIESTKPVGVVSGNHCANVPAMNRACDYIVEMDMPVHAWGKFIPVGRIPNRKYSGIIRIFAGEKDTKVWRDGIEIMTIPDFGGKLGRGFQEMRVYPGEGSRNGFFKADKPFSITYYNPGVQEDGAGTDSDPFSMAIIPIEQFQKEILFATPAVAGGLNFPENYLNIIYEVDSTGLMPDHIEIGNMNDHQGSWYRMNSKFSGQDLPFNDVYEGKKYALKFLQLPHDGVYRIRSETPFGCYSFGYSFYDSYGYPTSAAVADITTPDVDPPLVDYEMSCTGDIIATVTDMPNDPEIRSNLSDIFFRKDLSFNYSFHFADIVPGETITTVCWLTVNDPSEDARAVIFFKDRAGNDTIMIFNYSATKLDMLPDHFFGEFMPDEIVTKEDFIVRNLNDNSNVVIPDESHLKLKSGQEGFTIENLPSFPLTLTPFEEKQFSIKFTASEPGEFRDSVGVGDTCTFRYFAEVTAYVYNNSTEGLDIQADHNFGDFYIGDSKEKDDFIVRNLANLSYAVIPDESFLRLKSGIEGFTLNNDLTFPLTLLPLAEEQFSITFDASTTGTFKDSVGVGDATNFEYFIEVGAKVIINDVETDKYTANNSTIKYNHSKGELDLLFTSDLIGNFELRVFNITGIMLKSTIFTKYDAEYINTIPIDQLISGNYFYHILNNGLNVSNGKFTITK